MQTPIDKLAARGEQDLSLTALAKKLNMNSHAIMGFENGRTNPRAETVLMIAAALHISIDSVLYSESAMPSAVPAEVLEFFSGKSKEESADHIAICRQIEALNQKEKYDSAEPFKTGTDSVSLFSEIGGRK